VTYSIVRPTAFFKSLAGQVSIVKGGNPYVMFGDGEICKANAISEADLAEVMADCITLKVGFATERCRICRRRKDFRR
jgi:divinyl chlorophyllide a 8-vinyl-reductase